jgi:23S rRNA (uracil1939-C5)-methyltransferase
LNPPRRGINRKVVNALLEKPPARIVYVSCDPATLSRDVKLLSAAFQLAAVRGFDLFPQTAHVETVATLILDSTANSRQPTADS